MSKYLITGNAGLIGANLADYILTNTSDEVYGIDDLSGGYAENVHPNTEFYHMNLNSDELSDVFSEIKPDYVFHLAGIADIVPSIENPSKYFQSNVVGTLNVVESSKKAKIKKFICFYINWMLVSNHVPFSLVGEEIDAWIPVDVSFIKEFWLPDAEILNLKEFKTLDVLSKVTR